MFLYSTFYLIHFAKRNKLVSGKHIRYILELFLRFKRFHEVPTAGLGLTSQVYIYIYIYIYIIERHTAYTGWYAVYQNILAIKA